MKRYLIVVLTTLLFVFFSGALAFSFCITLSHSANAQLMSLPGKFDVSPEGSASFSIPISVPPGTGGMVPDLSFDYTSGGGNGPLGVGWSIGGLFAITRCPQTFAQDGYRGSITYDVGVTSGHADNDRFCLNGERLISINGGTYGADGTQYRTEVESFSKIVSHGTTGSSPSYFDVYTKSGQIIEFGNTSDSRVMLSNIASARSWLVDKITDTTGNYMTISYVVNPSGVSGNISEVLPSQILYTGNSNTGLAPYNKVTFNYTTRPDITPLYTAGALSESTQRLTSIETWAGSTAANNYDLSYQTSVSGRSLLSSVTLCDGSGSSGTCLPARAFTYQAASAGTFTEHVQTIGTNYGAPPTAGWTPISGDFNGDGRADFGFVSGNTIIVHLSNGDGTFTEHVQTISGSFGAPPNTLWTPISGDFNGDGKTDFGFVSGNQITTFFSNGDGSFTEHGQTLSGSFGSPPTANWTPISGDFNADGRSDFGFVANASILTFFSNGDGTFTEHAQALGGSFGQPPTANWTPISGDFNGDGKGDFGFVANSVIYTFLSNGDGTFTQHGQTVSGSFGSPATVGWTLFSGDFNGDGLADFGFVAGSTVETFLSKGDGSFSQVAQSISTTYTTPPAAGWTLISGDFNGDGKSDFGFVSGTTVINHISKGDGTFTEYVQTIGTNYGSPPSNGWAEIDGDFNGDGASDFAFVSGTTVISHLSNSLYPDLLTSITNGLGASTSINYGTLAVGWGSYYVGWNTSTCSTSPVSYPTVDISGATPVVTSTSSSTGIGATGAAAQYGSSFFYGCARVDTNGRGFLGFYEQAVQDSQTGIVQTTLFHQDFPYIGLISTQSKTSGSVLLNNVSNTYGALTGSTSTALPWTGTQFPYVATSVVSSNDLNGTALPTATTTYTYDSYGNALTITTSKSLGSTAGSSQTTTNQYQAANTTLWILGRLTNSVVVSTTP